jgi:nitrite reductase/ring-hydroxylating ferredoxin subunit
MNKKARLCHVTELPDSGAAGFDVTDSGRDSIFVVKHKTGYRAYANSCPHVPGTSLAWKKNAYMDAQQSTIVCSAHGARFDIGSGLCSSGPCKGQHLMSVPLHINTSGEVFVDENCSALGEAIVNEF